MQWPRSIVLGLPSALLLAAPAAAVSELKTGGTLRVAGLNEISHVDPAVADNPVALQVQYATALKLFNYVGGPRIKGTRLVPEAVSSYSVSRDGTVYTFTIRSGFRFATGERVTAKHFRHAIRRALDPRIESSARFMISGLSRVRVTGARTTGNRLILTLAEPSSRLLGVLATPFFQAVPLSAGVPGRAPSQADVLPSAGPYSIATYEPRKRLVLVRNRFYGGRRPQRLDAIEFSFGIAPEQTVPLVEAGHADYTTYLLPAVHGELARKYGVNGGQFRVSASECVEYLTFNPASPLFQDNPALRRAVGYALDRRQLATAYGTFHSRPHDQFFPPSVPGFRDLKLFPLGGPDLATANRLASGHKRHAHATMVVHGVIGPSPWHLAVQRALASIGITLDLRMSFGLLIPTGDLYWDGWCSREDLGDRVDGLETWAYYAKEPRFEQKARAAQRLRGAARRAAADRLERELTKDRALIVPWGIRNVHELFSARVEPGSIRFQPIYGAVDLAALALK